MTMRDYVTTAPAEQGYTADDMTHLEGLDAVRKRPGMYIGSTDSKGLNHMVWEVVDNSVDEALAGHCSRIEIVLHPDGSVEVSDNGRGIPTGVNTKTGLTGVEMAYTLLHAGGKFGGSGYKSAGGLHGVGASVVNALSQRVDVTVRQASKVHSVSFQRGVAGVFDSNGPSGKFKPAKGLRITGKVPVKTTGTTVRFWSDPMIFLKDAALDIEAIYQRARQTAFLVPGLALSVKDGRNGAIEEQTFQFDGGIVDMVRHLTPSDAKPLTGVLNFTGEGTYKETVPMLDEQGHMVSTEVLRTVEVNVALDWNTGYDTTVRSFVNVVSTPDGGTHNNGFEAALRRTLPAAIQNTRGLLKVKEELPTLDDCLEGVTAVISSGVTKAVTEVVATGLKRWMDDRKTKAEAKIILTKIVEASRVRLTQKQTKEAARRKTAMEGASMPAKLVDCRSTGVDRSELFIVEGDSALGSAKDGRTSEYQALLPIRGKILNVQKATLAQVLANAECSSIIQVIGAGSGRTFDLEQMRYGRVVIMADADVDGSHIRTLLITLFYRFMQPLIEAGRLYTAVPPLFRVITSGKNRENFDVYNPTELQAVLDRLEKAGKGVKEVKRFKGLGEMDADDLWSTTMNPATRTVRRITMDDAERAGDLLELLMGDKVEPRRDWIVERSGTLGREEIDA
jgi:DNA gyrase subunit B